MNEPIIITRGNYGIELSVQFLNNKKKPIDITGQTVDVIIIKSNGDKTSHNAYLTAPLEGKCGFILTDNETSVTGLCSAFFSLVDEDSNVTAQEDLYYFIKEEHGGNTRDITPPSPLDDKVLDAWSRTQIIDAIGEHSDLADKLNSLDTNITNQEVIEARGTSGSLNNRFNKNEADLIEANLKIESNKNKLDDFFNLSEIILNDYSDIINQKISQKINIKFPNRTIKISKPILWNGEVSLVGLSQELSKIQPNTDFIGEALLIVPSENSKFKKGTISNLTFNCDFIVNKGIWLKNGCFMTIKNSTIKNFKDIGLHLGDGTNRVYASFFTDLKISGDDTFSKTLEQLPNHCIYTQSGSMDNNFINLFIWNSKISLFRDDVGSNRIISCHGWGDLPNKFPNYCFELNGVGTLISNSKADSPKIAGFKINNAQNFLTGNQILLANTIENGYNACYFEISTNSNNGTKITNNMCSYSGIYPTKDTIFNCDTIHVSCIIKNNQIVSGYRYLNNYDTLLSNIGAYNSIRIIFPKPLSSNKYLIFAQGLWDCGNVEIYNKTIEGYSVRFSVAPLSGNQLITKFSSIDN